MAEKREAFLYPIKKMFDDLTLYRNRIKDAQIPYPSDIIQNSDDLAKGIKISKFVMSSVYIPDKPSLTNYHRLLSMYTTGSSAGTLADLLKVHRNNIYKTSTGIQRYLNAVFPNDFIELWNNREFDLIIRYIEAFTANGLGENLRGFVSKVYPSFAKEVRKVSHEDVFELSRLSSEGEQRVLSNVAKVLTLCDTFNEMVGDPQVIMDYLCVQKALDTKQFLPTSVHDLIHRYLDTETEIDPLSDLAQIEEVL